MKKVLIGAVAVAVLLLAISPFYASPPGDNPLIDEALTELGYTTVRLRKTAFNEYEVNAVLNGDKPITLLLSFQATNTIFNAEKLKSKGVGYEETGQEFEVNGDDDDLYVVRTDSINIGDGKIGSEELYCIKFKKFDAFEDYRVDGILGRDFLIKYNAILDFANQKLYIKTDY